ncbi:ArsR/SmtB family transcription factor [Halorientalis brevis]|uniref:ArsR/SmtB family transcription factor n=1 Tax=Halorientalis brevis TaxID=1126241 RepID=A0ABD6C9P8_9EURY|nr:helix-turn-helix domain-containing protein [Halorientalis brevis]
MSLLPSEPDTSAVDETEPRVIDVNSEDADEVLSALTSDTARKVLSELHDDPAPPAELSDRVDTSLQNVQYHLNKLEDAGAIEVIDQIYSEKGREMNVYAPADQPLVIFAGAEEQSTGLRAALSRFLGSLGIIALASVVIQEVFGGGLTNLFGSGSGGTESAGGGGGAPAPAPAPTSGNETATPTPAGGAGGNETGDTGIQIASEPSTTDGTDQVTEEAADAATKTVDIARDTPVDKGTTGEATRTATETVNATVQNATDAAGSGGHDVAAAATSLQPGVLFFLGGVTALAVVAGVWYVTN